jgi:tRNA A37 threonylcarbamoyladenosine synthetase subunit TsaC/SUA5/YrdC
MDTYPDIDFVVDCGFEDAAPSTVIDMTTGIPVILREGRGDASLFRT